MKKLTFALISLLILSLTGPSKGVNAGSIGGKIALTNGTALKGIKIDLKNYPAKDAQNYLFWEGRAQAHKTYTGADGKYEFKTLLEGNYYLTIELPQGTEKAYEYVNTPASPIKLPEGKNIKDTDFTLKQVRTIISGRIYEKNAVTPYANVSLELSCNGKIYSTTTDEKGNYIFIPEPTNGQWEITIKDKNKIVPSTLNFDLSKVNTFENVNIICAK